MTFAYIDRLTLLRSHFAQQLKSENMKIQLQYVYIVVGNRLSSDLYKYTIIRKSAFEYIKTLKDDSGYSV